MRYELQRVCETLSTSPRRLPARLLGYARGYVQVRDFRRLSRPRVDPETVVAFAYTAANGLLGPQQVRTELLSLARRVAARQPRVVVEIGTADGGTLFVFGTLAHPEATVVSIDLPGGNHGGGYPSWKRSMYRSFAREDQQIHLLRGDSHSSRQQLHLEHVLGGRPIDFLFIDGDHTYAGVRADFDTYAPLVRPGGLIAIHDICTHDPEARAGVDRLWRELCATYETEELIEDTGQGWAGIGLVLT